MNAPSFERVGLFVASVLLGVATLAGWRTGEGIGVLAILVGASERLQRPLLENGSDVVRATREAIEILLRGANPYATPLQTTIPPGSPLGYGPGELYFYLPSLLITGDIVHVEMWAGIVTIAVLAFVGFRVGFERATLPAMVYATWGIAAFRTTDGGNDVAAALVVVVGLVALAFATPPEGRAAGRIERVAFVVSAVMFGWALGFKQFVVLLIPLVLRHLAVTGAPWKKYALILGGVTAFLDAPFILWDARAFLNQHVVLALTNHQTTWGANLIFTIAQVDAPLAERLLPFFFALELILTFTALGLCLRWRIPTLGAAALAGGALIALPFFLARWTTQSYYVYAATLALAGLALIEHRASVTKPASVEGPVSLA